MSRRWAVRVEKTEVDSVQKLRLAEGAEICEQAEDIWVRGEQLDEPLARLLRRHPHARRHWVLPDNQLVSPGQRVPRGYLPEGPWTPLREWLTARLPEVISAGRWEGRVRMQLVRSADERPANVLLLDVACWQAYGSQAPQVRLARWHFAAAADRRVAVRGLPLPPLPGERYVEQDGVAAPAGWSWLPAVEPAVLREVLGLEDHDLALLHSDGTWERIGAEQFVRATRSAIRETARGFGHD
jgi:hypothetical protein